MILINICQEQKELLSALAKQELARRNFLEYNRYVHGRGWKEGKHITYICNKTEQFLEDKLINQYNNIAQILVIEMPPQHGKSQTITETLPSWYVGKNPDFRVIIASYNDTLAKRFNRRNKKKIEEMGEVLFSITLSKAEANELEIKDHKGGVISRGIMAGITGSPAELIIIDDPVKNRQEADSPVFRERVYNEYLDVVKSRLSAKGKIIVIQTRWHKEDLAGKILDIEKEKCYEIKIPLEAGQDDVLGRNAGDALFPEIGKDKEWLQNMKKSYITKEGRRSWLALYQGTPSDEAGNMIQRSWLKYYKREELPSKFDEVIQSWDCTFKESDGTDFVSGQVWARKGVKCFLLYAIKERMDFVKTIKAISDTTILYPQAYIKLIEDKANGPAVISYLRNKISGILPVEPQGSKKARFSAVTPMFEAGNIYIPHIEEQEWVGDYIEELINFPNAEHDDQVDSTSQALNRFKNIEEDVEKEQKALPFALQSNPEREEYIEW